MRPRVLDYSKRLRRNKWKCRNPGVRAPFSVRVRWHCFKKAPQFLNLCSAISFGTRFSRMVAIGGVDFAYKLNAGGEQAFG